MTQKNLILLNVIVLTIALYTHISLYAPSLLNFSNEAYVSKGGDHFFDGLFLSLFHYLNLILFIILNGVFILKAILKKKIEGVLIVILFTLFMLSIHFFINKKETTSFIIEEVHSNN